MADHNTTCHHSQHTAQLRLPEAISFFLCGSPSHLAQFHQRSVQKVHHWIKAHHVGQQRQRCQGCQDCATGTSCLLLYTCPYLGRKRLTWIEAQHAGHQRQRRRRRPRQQRRQRHRWHRLEAQLGKVRRGGNARPGLGAQAAVHLGHPAQLVDVALAGQQRRPACVVG